MWDGGINNCIYTCTRARERIGGEQDGSKTYSDSNSEYGVCGLKTGYFDAQDVKTTIDCGTSKWAWETCHHPHENPLLFQPYPIEAALATVTNSILNVIGLWPQHTMNQTLAMQYDVLDLDIGDGGTIAELLQKAIEDYMLLPRRIWVQSVKNTVLMIRDVVAAIVQFARAVVYVTQGSEGLAKETPFSKFFEITRDILAIIQLIVAELADLFIEAFEKAFTFVSYIIMAISNPNTATDNIQKAFDLVLAFLVEAAGQMEQMFFGILFEIDGLGNFITLICDTVLGIVQEIINVTCDVIEAKFLPSSVLMKCIYFQGSALANCKYMGEPQPIFAEDNTDGSPPGSTFGDGGGEVSFGGETVCADTSSYFMAPRLPIITTRNDDGKAHWFNGRHTEQLMPFGHSETYASTEQYATMCWNMFDPEQDTCVSRIRLQVFYSLL